MSDECERKNAWWRACRFEARYDIGAPDLSRFRRLQGYSLTEMIEALKPTNYVRDVCIRCGKTIERQAK